MTSLVIGSSGRVGQALCRLLRASGDVVDEFDIVRDPAQDARSAQLDLSGVDCVFLLAWDVGGANYLSLPTTQLSQLEWNTSILTNVLTQVTEGGPSLVFVSSQLAQDPNSVYGVTKHLGEIWTQRLGGVSVRLWNAYGALEPISERSQSVSDFVVQAVTTGTIRVQTTGVERRRFAHLDDIAQGLLMAASEPSLAGTVVDLAAADATSIAEIAQQIASLTGAGLTFGERLGQELDLQSFSNVPRWSERWTLESGLADMVQRALLADPSASPAR